MRVVAFIKASSPKANHSLRLDRGVSALDGESLAPVEIMELDAAGHVDWTHGSERQLVAELAARKQDGAEDEHA